MKNYDTCYVKSACQKTSILEPAFQFGKNWEHFLKTFSMQRLDEAKRSLCSVLGCTNLNNIQFLDVGSGSGLFSLAAYQLGAKVTSFDYDANSVDCTKMLRKQFANEDQNWQIFQGSILDQALIASLGKYDLVYSWGVLHHTGNMYQAFTNVIQTVNPKGKLFISIYNDQGGASKRWHWIKKTYNKSNKFIKTMLTIYTLFRQWIITFVRDLLKTGNPFKSWQSYSTNRGMSAWYDLIDWVGGYPFEVAKPEQVFNFFTEQGFELQYLKTCAGGVGCNEFVFCKK